MSEVKVPRARSMGNQAARISLRRVRQFLRLAFDVMIVYPAVALVFLLLLGGGFTFDGMARVYVDEMATYAGRPATPSELTAMVCKDPHSTASPQQLQATAEPVRLSGACAHWEPQLVSKDLIANKLSFGARVAYWFLVLTALGVRLALFLGGSILVGSPLPGGRRANHAHADPTNLPP
jgi:cytosine/adenosine deaminase-related metal-dependent hydrolase